MKLINKQSALRTLGVAVILGTGVVIDDAHAAGGWKDHNTALEAGYQVALALDMFTTMDIKRHDDIEEVGPARHFLGSNPEKAETAVYFAASGLLHYAVSRALPRGYREGFQAVSLVVEGGYAVHNIRLGLKWTW